MDLYTKITTIYPELNGDDFNPMSGTILLWDDSLGDGDYIAKWEHPTLAQPTQEQLDGVAE